MRGFFFGSLLALAGLAACGGGGARGGGSHGPIAGACMASGRGAVSPAACGCIQQVANRTLRPADQGRAVRFFRNPELAESARSADSRSAEAFWDRYAAFGAEAEASCAGL